MIIDNWFCLFVFPKPWSNKKHKFKQTTYSSQSLYFDRYMARLDTVWCFTYFPAPSPKKAAREQQNAYLHQDTATAGDVLKRLFFLLSSNKDASKQDDISSCSWTPWQTFHLSWLHSIAGTDQLRCCLVLKSSHVISLGPRFATHSTTFWILSSPLPIRNLACYDGQHGWNQ